MGEVVYWDDNDQRAKYLHGCPKKLTVDQKFRRILRLLRQDYPADYPIRVRRVENPLVGPDAPYGDCGLINSDKPKNKRYYLIRLAKSNTWKQQFETLLHEWAHCLTWHLVENHKDHGDIFHRKYGVLYRAYIED